MEQQDIKQNPSRQTQQHKRPPIYDIGKDGHYGACQQVANAGQAPDPNLYTGPWTNINTGLKAAHKDVLSTYWQGSLRRLEDDDHDYKMHQLPLARIKKVMKADPDVKMISAEAPILFAKGCDIFITELSMRAWIHAEENKRRTLQRSDIATALAESDMFDFLIDIVPREELQAANNKRPPAGGTGPPAPPSQPPMPQQPSMPPQQQASHQMPPQGHPGPSAYEGFPQHMGPEQDFRQPPPMYVQPGQPDYAHAPPPMFEPTMYGGYGMPPQQMYQMQQRAPDPQAGQQYRPHDGAEVEVVAGASGGIGQPLSLLMKASPLVDELSLYDVVNTPGVTADLSHISSVAKISGFLPADDGMKHAFTGADMVVIPAGIPRKPGMTRDDLFKINAGIVRDLVKGVAEHCPKAFVLVISNPVNSTVPIAAEVLKNAGCFEPKRLFGVTTLDVVRAETFAQEYTGEKDPSKTVIPVIGGHSGETIVPLWSQAKPAVKIPADKLDAITNRVQFGGDEVVKAKDGAGSATLSMAYAGFRFAERLMKAVKGQSSAIEPTFMYMPGVPGGQAIVDKTGCDFFSVPVELDASGAKQAHDVVSSANEYEQKLLQACYTGLKTNIQNGVEFIKNPPPPPSK
ncbi:MAG: hypothetical protein M1828_002672 [Chrysothrix sp. TS-e1954]|nr:MAG: hypothetical protein M1828_002672 [Chrysothrix sp. TS-e1954]